MELNKGVKSLRKKIGLAWLVVYTALFIHTGLIFLVRVPILSLLGLPLKTVRARVKFGLAQLHFAWGISFYTAKFIQAEPFFWYAYHFYPSRARNFWQCKSALRMFALIVSAYPYCARNSLPHHALSARAVGEMWRYIHVALVGTLVSMHEFNSLKCSVTPYFLLINHFVCPLSTF